MAKTKSIDLSDRERSMIANGLIALIRDAGKAKELVIDSRSQKEIDRHIKELQALNSKICLGE